MATLDDTNSVAPGGRVLISSTIADASTGLAPVPLPDVVTMHIFKPDVTGVSDYIEDSAPVMIDDGPALPTDAVQGEKYSVSYQVPSDGPAGAWLTQISMQFASFGDLGRQSATFWVIT